MGVGRGGQEGWEGEDRGGREGRIVGVGRGGKGVGFGDPGGGVRDCWRGSGRRKGCFSKYSVVE